MSKLVRLAKQLSSGSSTTEEAGRVAREIGSGTSSRSAAFLPRS